LLTRILSLRDKTDDLLKHGSIMVAAGLSVGLINYVFQLIMGILLSPAQYGTFISLSSLYNIVKFFTRTFQLSVAKFASTFRTEDRWGRIHYLWIYSLKRTFLIGLALFIISASLSPVISKFLNIDNVWFLPVLFCSFVFTFALPVNLGMLQGLQKFVSLGLSNCLQALTRLAIGVLLVFLGFGLYGALSAYFCSYVILFIITIIMLRYIRKTKSEEFKTSILTSYAGLTIIAIFSFAVLTNVDVIIVKHFLSKVEAGNFGVVAILGKIAFFTSNGIIVAMFPKMSDLFEAGKKTYPLLIKTLIYVGVVVGGVVLVYWLFSEPIINLLYGDKYPLVAPNLVRYALAMALFSFSFTMMNYLLSLNRTRVAFCFLAGMFLEIGLISAFHSSISQVVDMMLISSASCLFLVILYYMVVRHSLIKKQPVN